MSVRVIDSLRELLELDSQEVIKSDWLEITQDQINKFGKITGDTQWIHTDKLRAARESPFGCTIAHGFLTISLLVHFMESSISMPFSVMGVNYGFNRLRFTSPVKVGSKIRGCFRINEIFEIEGGVQIVWDVHVESNESDKPALVAEWVTRRYV